MVKLFLVEDEIAVRQGIKNNIKWNEAGIEFVGEAGDGELAYPLIIQSKPDIIITDIRMPFMDGLALSRLVKAELPHTKIIILSSYDEFEYAQQAISIGVTDYMVKPVIAIKLFESMKKLAAQVEDEKRQRADLERYKQEAQETIMLERAKIFDLLIKGGLSASSLMHKAKELELNIASPCYSIMLFKARSAKQHSADDYSYQQVIVDFSNNLENAYLKSPDALLFDRGAAGFALLLKSDESNSMEQLQKIHADKIGELIKLSSELRYFGGISEPVSRISQLPLAYDDAVRALSYRYIMPQSDCFIYSKEAKPISLFAADEGHTLRDINVSSIDRKAVENFLKNGNASEVRHFIEDYCSTLGYMAIHSSLFRQYLSMDVYFCACQFLISLGVSEAAKLEICGRIEDINENLKDASSALNYMEKLLAGALLQRDAAAASKYIQLLDKAKAYIGTSFSSQSISLNDVAAHVNLSPSHFSNVFSQQAGQTFTEYLTAVRMEKARELLKCTSKKTNEIGFEIGYRDSHYFSYIFKKTQGCTPSEFRSQGGIEK